MDLVQKILWFCVVCYGTLCCYAGESYYPEIEACAVQYLKQKGKLDESIQSTIPPSSRCQLLVPFVLQLQKSIIKDIISRDYSPNETVCLIDQYDKTEAFDLIAKKALIKHSSLFDDSAQTEDISNQYAHVTKAAKVLCVTDESDTTVFNQTLEAHQHQYCMAKYAIDKQLSELINVDINPNHIDPDSVNCDNIVKAELREAENEYSSKVSTIEADHGSSKCAMYEFRRGNMFGWRVALKVLYFFNISDKIITAESNRVYRKVEDFLSMSSTVCDES